MSKECRCKELERIASIMALQLRSLQECILEGNKVLDKDNEDIDEILRQYNEYLNNK